MIRWGGAAGAIAAIGVTFAVGAPATAQELPQLQIDPTSGEHGTVITVSGEGCIDEIGPGGAQAYFVSGNIDTGAGAYSPSEFVEADESGAWTVDVTVLAVEGNFDYYVTARCSLGGDPSPGNWDFDYERVPFEVTSPVPSDPTTPTTQAPSTDGTTPPTTEPDSEIPPTPTSPPVVADPPFYG